MGQTRVIFRASPAFDETANVFAEVLPGDEFKIQLLHDYPDLKPEVGWRVEAGGKLYEIKSVKDGALECAEVKVEAAAAPKPLLPPSHDQNFTS